MGVFELFELADEFDDVVVAGEADAFVDEIADFELESCDAGVEGFVLGWGAGGLGHCGEVMGLAVRWAASFSSLGRDAM